MRGLIHADGYAFALRTPRRRDWPPDRKGMFAAGGARSRPYANVSSSWNVSLWDANPARQRAVAALAAKARSISTRSLPSADMSARGKCVVCHAWGPVDGLVR